MPRKKQRVYTPEFKAKVALEAIRGEESLSKIASKYEMHVNNVLNWRDEALKNMSGVFSSSKDEIRHKKELKEKEKKIDNLYKEIGQLTTEVNWAKKKIKEYGL